MGKETVEALVEGGKASAAPPLGPALGPTGINIGEVVAEINKKTGDFKGMKVPVKVVIDTSTKEFTIEIGTPPAAQLIKKEADIKSGAGNPLTDKVADLLIEQVIKISKMKQDSLLGNDTKARVKEIVGTCQSMGILVEGMPAPEALKAIDEGKFDEKIIAGKTELSEEEKQHLAEEKKKLEEEMQKKRAEFEGIGKEVMKQMGSVKDMKKIRAKMQEAGVPMPIINELAPLEEAK
jgi:large subunit ribosomal protein L11